MRRPRRRLAAAPSPELIDDAEFFGYRDEASGLDHAEFRVTPAQEGLEAADLLGVHVEQGLIEDGELIPAQNLSDVRFQLAAGAVFRGHFRLEHTIGAAPFGFCPVEGDVR